MLNIWLAYLICNTHIQPVIITDPFIPIMIQSFSIIFRYEEYAVVKANRDSVFEVLEKTINEFSHWQKLHKVKHEFLQTAHTSHKLELFLFSLNVKFFEKSNIVSVQLYSNTLTNFHVTACGREYPGSPVPEDVCWCGHPPQFGNHQFRPSHWLFTGRWPESDCVSGILKNLHIYTYLTLSTCMYYLMKSGDYILFNLM